MPSHIEIARRSGALNVDHRPLLIGLNPRRNSVFSRTPLLAWSHRLSVVRCVPPLMSRPSRRWGWSGRSPKRAAGPTLRDGIVPVERTVHDAGPDFQHQMSTPRRPAHLLLGIHSPLHRTLGDRRRNRFFLPARCRVVDDDVGLSGHISLQIAQEPRHLARGGGVADTSSAATSTVTTVSAMRSKARLT